jgi:hypothetical protein
MARFPPACPRESSQDARAIGSYLPQRFLITFDASLPFITAERRRDIRYFHIFAHEYFHYWHNISTVVGFRLLGLNHQLLAAFSRTLNEPLDGTSAGASVLSGDDVHHCSELLALVVDLEGDGAPNADSLHNSNVTFAVTDYSVDHQRRAPLRSQQVPNPGVALSVVTFSPNGEAQAGTMALGAYAIEEGIAMLVEQAIAEFVADARSDDCLEYPYKVLERTVEKIVGARQSPYVCASLGTLALLTTHPGPGLVVLAELYRDHLQAAGPDEALERVIEQTRGIRESDLRSAREGAQQVVRMQEGRGLSEMALQHFQRQLDAAIEVRLADPLLDIKTVFQAENPRSALINMLEKFPSCDIVQQAEGPDGMIERDRTLGEPVMTESGFTTSEATRVLHAQFDYVWAHIDREVGEFASSNSVAAKCPYFTTCGLPLRSTQPDVCATQPWRSIQEPKGLCTYAVGVAAVFSPIEVKKPR